MKPSDIQLLIDVVKQVFFGFGKIFLDALLATWNSLPGLPAEIKGVLIGLVLIAFLLKILKHLKSSYHIQNFIEKIAYTINR